VLNKEKWIDAAPRRWINLGLAQRAVVSELVVTVRPVNPILTLAPPAPIVWRIQSILILARPARRCR